MKTNEVVSGSGCVDRRAGSIKLPFEARTIKHWATLLIAVIVAVAAEATYAIDVDFTTDPGWTSSNNASSGNSFGWSSSTNHANGATGEVGGTFARAQVDAFYGDTNLSSTLTLNDVIHGEGKFDLLNITAGWAGGGTSGIFVGHFSQAAGSREFLGLEFREDSATTMAVRFRFQLPSLGGADTPFVSLSTNGNHTFDYTYDPNLGDDGRVTLILNGGSPVTVDLSGGERTSGAIFNAFGMGYTNNLNSENEAEYTAQVFIDDVSYTGFIIPEPSTIALACTGMLGAICLRLRQRRT